MPMHPIGPAIHRRRQSAVTREARMPQSTPLQPNVEPPAVSSRAEKPLLLKGCFDRSQAFVGSYLRRLGLIAGVQEYGTN